MEKVYPLATKILNLKKKLLEEKPLKICILMKAIPIILIIIIIIIIIKTIIMIMMMLIIMIIIIIIIIIIIAQTIKHFGGCFTALFKTTH